MSNNKSFVRRKKFAIQKADHSRRWGIRDFNIPGKNCILSLINNRQGLLGKNSFIDLDSSGLKIFETFGHIAC